MLETKSPCLIVFSGLPGTGKTSVAQGLARSLGAAYLRIDEIEQAMKTAGLTDIGPAGYDVAMALAKSNLSIGTAVVADCVNPVRESRRGWQLVAEQSPARLVDVLVICSNADAHQRRVENRRADIPGHVMPTWADVLARDFEPHDAAHIVIDSADTPPELLVARCLDHLARSEI